MNMSFDFLLLCSLLLSSGNEGFVMSRRLWIPAAASASILPNVSQFARGNDTDEDDATSSSRRKRRRKGRLPKVVIFGTELANLAMFFVDQRTPHTNDSFFLDFVAIVRLRCVSVTRNLSQCQSTVDAEWHSHVASIG